MKRDFRILLLFAFIAFAFNAKAQNLSIDNILKANLKNMSTIKDGEDVTGYVFFYEVDKKDRKTRNYLVQFTDQNLNEVASKRITGTKYLSLLDGKYNGETIMLKLIDAKEKSIIFKQYDRNADLVYSKVREFNIRTGGYRQTKEGDITSTGGVQFYPVLNKGFTNIEMTKNKKLGYTIEFFPKAKKTKGWKFGSDENSKMFEAAMHLGTSDDIYLANVIRRPSLMSRDVSCHIIGLNVETGKKLYEVELNDSKYNVFSMNSYFDKTTENATILGYYYDSDDKSMKGNSKGLCAITINKSGEIISKKYVSWTKDVSKFLDVNQKGKIKGEGYVHFHNFFTTSDGRIFAFGEQYKRSADALGIAANALGGTGNLSKIVIEDMVFFEFTSDFELKNVKIMDKFKSTFPVETLGANMQLAGYLVSAYGGFDYAFTQRDPAEDVFTVVYTDYDRDEKEFKIKSTTWVDGEFEEDSFSFETKKSSKGILPAKDGFILVMEYLYKENRLDMRLEKVDY